MSETQLLFVFLGLPWLILVVIFWVAFSVQKKAFQPYVNRFQSMEVLPLQKVRIPFSRWEKKRMKDSLLAAEENHCLFVKILFLPLLKIPYSSCSKIEGKKDFLNTTQVRFTFKDPELKPLRMAFKEKNWPAFPELKAALRETPALPNELLSNVIKNKELHKALLGVMILPVVFLILALLVAAVLLK